MLKVIAVIVIIVILISTRKKNRAMVTGDFAAYQERRAKSARVKTVFGILFLVVSVVIWAAVLLSPPREVTLDDYNLEKLEELSQQGIILESDRTEDQYDSVQSRLDYSGATAEKYESFWNAIDSARFAREAEFWNGMGSLIENADVYMERALERLRS